MRDGNNWMVFREIKGSEGLTASFAGSVPPPPDGAAIALFTLFGFWGKALLPIKRDEGMQMMRICRWSCVCGRKCSNVSLGQRATSSRGEGMTLYLRQK
ncbi:hypothetical protein CEXT_725701 [Caerostris extrusa]|uniref:Uncharacterized protein n=1 Tax=Caerostris extrusa TaxID=172846 RepID=A0AAV4MLU4_CAEEX|nr:hypothetical protein CEXT_725701 [Caerostris extrusa]